VLKKVEESLQIGVLPKQRVFCRL